VAEYGTEAVAGRDVHHINGIGWDNRPENIVPIPPELHPKVERDGIEQWEQELKEMGVEV